MRAAALLVLLAICGCARGDADPVAEAESLAEHYWRMPLDEQGEAPAEWSELERSLSPEACGRCHIKQFAEWETAIHAAAMSPGLVGQLLGLDSEEAASCLECHAPLAEQRLAFEMARVQNQAHRRQAQGLAAAGNSCAGCHVRGWRYYGPPQSGTNMTGQSAPPAPHGGVYRTRFFQSSEFCSGCHQFPAELAINGKPLENTFVEWQASPQAANGVGCQDCHMPERKHLWRGIHDPDMVENGLTVAFRADADAAHFSLTSTGVGHAFPTYVTPKVIMLGVALDAVGMPRGETEVEHIIQRVVEHIDGEWVEHSDSRLLPGETVTLTIPWQGSERVRMWLEVHPDDFYDHRVYDYLLDELAIDDVAGRLIARADSLARASHYRIFDTEITRP